MEFVAIEGNFGTKIKPLLKFIHETFQVHTTLNYCISHKSSFFDDNKRLKTLTTRDTSRWAFAANIKTILDKYKYLYNTHTVAGIVFTNKSYKSDIECLLKTYYDLKYVTSEEYTIYNNLIGVLQFPKYKYIIYIKSDPNECYESLIESKDFYDFEFIQAMHQVYEAWIKKLQKQKEYNILVLNSCDITYNDIAKDNIIQKLKTFFKSAIVPREHIESEEEWTTVISKRKSSKHKHK